MRIRTRTTAVAVAGALGVAGLGIGLGLPASADTVASSAEDGVAAAVADRLQAIKDALAGLVEDGTLTQEQVDEVATTLQGSDALRGGPGGHGGHGPGGRLDLDAAATALGLDEEELRTALEDGSTLADVAEEQGVETSELVDALVAAATERIEQGVTDGRITQEQADELVADLPDRVTTAVEEGFRGRGPGGPDGDGPRGGGAAREAPSEAVPSAA